jgi:hypothetical protein
MRTKVRLERPKLRNHSEDLGIDGGIVLNVS